MLQGDGMFDVVHVAHEGLGCGERNVDGGAHRLDVLRELERRCATGKVGQRRLRIKRVMWFSALSLTRFVKRLLDVVGAGLGLLVLSPLMVSVAVLIWLHDRGPIFFSQKRVGQWGREFDCPKFRSMVKDAEALKAALLAQNQHQDGITFKMKCDPRITPIGRFIRKTSIDELPQLWSVFKGDMSLVGPRPPVPQEVIRYSLAQRRRLDMKPGLTCFWQVGGRGDVDFSEQVQMDIQYVDSQSFWLDVVLILRTVPAVLLGRGAY
jgi:lipopolysaccharide/colanic/teichoic acid biosynthesis glycosyltransferase